MCIAVLSTAHPEYPYVLLSNRDEFLNRPTAKADWWDAPNEHVLGGRDLQKIERGTWLAITRQGRLAILTNFREENVEASKEKSRGAIVNAYLTAPPDEKQSPEQFAQRLIEDVGLHDVGGFSLIYGALRAPDDKGAFPGLSIVSNRSASTKDLKHIATHTGETHGLSNSHFGDNTWPKVVHGEQLLHQAVETDISRSQSQDAFLESLFSILSTPNLRARKDGEPWDIYVRQMRNSILIPPVSSQGGEKEMAASTVNGTSTPWEGNVDAATSAGYGTQKQTVMLVDRQGKVLFVERTLYDGRGRKIDGKDGETRWEFVIEGWRNTR